ncbi:hypothetical protein KSS87_002706 [Heliosperma pusillum]|nr:hypothetical protein KSS87_011857 [Heliosperma pusillum]KAH9612426.1 hypothetical protein KSS87_002706 [Heliosperma pusillum]
MQTMGNEERKIPSSHKEFKCKLWVMKEDSLFTQEVTMQTMGNEERKNIELTTSHTTRKESHNRNTKLTT